MRAGGCTLQQSLTPDSAALVKQSIGLARRRGHAQVTPLHVASTMLSSSTGLLRTACLHSHSHPLQCKALELCFNVALNRLPATTTTTTPLLGHAHHHHHHHHHQYLPALSNALVAAFKRAQAHQRRGSIETQQQPLLAVKIEIEQLVLSILDDPSVSRVMREAGFSSTQVKANVEQAVSNLEIPSSRSPSPCADNIYPNNKPKEDDDDHRHQKHHQFKQHSLQFISTSPSRTPTTPQGSGGKINMSIIIKSSVEHEARDEDVTSVVECLISRKKRSVVVVGECLATTEGVVRGMMDKVERGQVPDVLKSVQFINLPLFSFAHLTKDQVEQKIGELRCLVKSCCVGGRGAVLYMGDLKWASEYRASCSGERSRSYYCPVEHVIMELGRMVCDGVNGETSLQGGRFWFLGIATYQTYMRCRVGLPSLETLWALHPLTIPAGSLGLSLSHDSYLQNPILRSKRNGDHQVINFCDYSTKSDENGIRAPNLPPWLQQYKENKASSDIQECLEPRDLITNFNQQASHQEWPPVQRNTNRPCSWKEHCFWTADANSGDQECFESNQVKKKKKKKNSRISPFLLGLQNPNSFSPVSTSSSEQSMEMEYHHRFKELNAENLKTMCNSLEKKVPWQIDIIPEIASTILQCRSGMVRRKYCSRGSNSARTSKEDTWLFFQGCDGEGKENISKELASLVFGSASCLVSIGSTHFDSGDDHLSKNKRPRSEATYIDRFAEAVGDNPHRVFLLEDMEQVDRHCQMRIKHAIERGAVRGSKVDGDKSEVGLEDAIVILSCETLDSLSRTCSPPMKWKISERNIDHRKENNKDFQDCEKEATGCCVCLDLNLSAGHDEEDSNIEDHDETSIADVAGLLELVDRKFYFFKMREDP